MKKNLISRLLLLIIMSISFNSCSSEEDILASKNEKHSKNFQVFTSMNGEPVNYAQGFRKLLEDYDSINHTKYSKSGLLKLSKVFNNSDEYIEFNIHSQNITLENGDKWVIYPRVKESAVSGLTIAVLSENETQVSYIELDPENEYYIKIIHLFREQLQKSTQNAKKMNKGSGCGFDGSPPCDIDEVIIIVPNPGGGNGSGGLGGGGGSPSGGCSKYENCIHNDFDGGGGGGGGLPPLNPCLRLKLQTGSPTFKNNITSLEGKTGDSYESGYRISSTSGGGVQNQLLQNKPGTDVVDMKVFPNTLALMHSHYDGLYPMFSPGDIIFFNQWIVYAQNYNANPANNPKIPINDLILTVVTSWGNYSFMFDGTNTNQFQNYTQAQLDEFDRTYMKLLDEAKSVGNVSGNVSYNMEKLEKEFLKFMGDKLNMPGAKLYRNTSSGNTQLSLVNGKLTETKCP